LLKNVEKQNKRRRKQKAERLSLSSQHTTRRETREFIYETKKKKTLKNIKMTEKRTFVFFGKAFF
jgi:hypothetical protein